MGRGTFDESWVVYSSINPCVINLDFLVKVEWYKYELGSELLNFGKI